METTRDADLAYDTAAETSDEGCSIHYYAPFCGCPVGT